MAETDEMFTIDLEGIEREIDMGEHGPCETFDVRFSCTRPDCSLEVRVTFDVKDVPTLEVVPRAMAEMRRAFAALAEQSAGWGPSAT
ncbi:hypothetical protein ASF53_05130 [Methylobacterium sp. Leaf123]|uniref:hypothetical protein n=1 Tax=Methylobacterium sp. Leaf123 TaxID=1736264 RepID=UPI0006FD577D|nr:hypothetical protein [Methylobacterium sp. Leaf123]KQQ23710.1 hypothetical protein ASF53_05130 [Methylobacterium sp. Leaf123]